MYQGDAMNSAKMHALNCDNDADISYLPMNNFLNNFMNQLSH